MALFLTGIITMMSVHVFFRYVLKSPLTWTEECTRYCFIWFVYSGIGYGVASVKEGKRVAFIAHQNLELREVVVSMFSSMLPEQSRVIHGPFGFGMDNEIEFIKQRNSADEGYLVIFLNQQDSYSWLKLIAGESPEKAIAYNFDFIPDLESEHETK